MKSFWPLYLFTFILFNWILSERVLAISSYSIQDESESLFNKKTVNLIGRIYMLSDPMNDPNELVCFIKDHTEYFHENGRFVKSIRILGTWMLDQKKSTLDKESILEVKNNLVDCQISEEYAYQLLIRFRNSDVKFTDLGNE